MHRATTRLQPATTHTIGYCSPSSATNYSLVYHTASPPQKNREKRDEALDGFYAFDCIDPTDTL